MKDIKIGMIVKLKYDDELADRTGILKGQVGVVTDTTEDGDLEIYIPCVNNTMAWVSPKDVSFVSDPLDKYRR